MRSDFDKVIIERPRRGGDGGKSIPSKKYKKNWEKYKYDDYEGSPRKESISRPYGWERKEFNDHLSPLYRYLHKQVGKKWDDVWSEICKNFPLTSLTADHFRDHVKMAVATHVLMINNKPHTVDYTVFPLDNRFYVHPDTGILCFQPKSESWQKRENRVNSQKPVEKFLDVKNKMGVDYEAEYHLINGLWYEIKLGRFKFAKVGLNRSEHIDAETGKFIKDVFNFQVTYLTGDPRKYMNDVYGKSKRQLNKKELKVLKKLLEESQLKKAG